MRPVCVLCESLGNEGISKDMELDEFGRMQPSGGGRGVDGHIKCRIRSAIPSRAVLPVEPACGLAEHLGQEPLNQRCQSNQRSKERRRNRSCSALQRAGPDDVDAFAKITYSQIVKYYFGGQRAARPHRNRSHPASHNSSFGPAALH